MSKERARLDMAHKADDLIIIALRKQAKELERAGLARCAEESEKQSEYEGGLLDRIAELEKELESSLYFNADVIRCLSKIAWQHNHDEIPHYMNLAKQCIKSIELKQFKALKEQIK